MSRSQQMARIRGMNTGPEMVLRSALWARGLRYRLHSRTPVGRPDLVFLGPRVAVCIDGCFWHGCPEHYVRPRSRAGFWAAKLAENVERDQRQTLQLETEGWRVARIWEHAVFTDLDGAVGQIDGAQGGLFRETEPGWRVLRVDPVDETGNIERRTLVSLRDPSLSKTVEQARHTRKWPRNPGIRSCGE